MEEQNQKFHMSLDAAADLARAVKREQMTAPIITSCSLLFGVAIYSGILYLIEKSQSN